jgi:hypothetical protein
MADEASPVSRPGTRFITAACSARTASSPVSPSVALRANASISQVMAERL